MADVYTKANLFSSVPSPDFFHPKHAPSVLVSSKDWNPKDFPSSSLSLRDDYRGLRSPLPPFASSSSTSGFRLGNVQKWWEKGLQSNMRELTSAQDLVDSLKNAGDQLVVLDFFSPGCGGCRALHPKLCQLAEMNPDVMFLQVNYEEHKSMCYSLNVHVLPFFRFYRGSQGKLCSFSCTNATIKKFKDALAKHTPDRCSIGPTKGLEEKELIALAANKDLSFSYTPQPVQLEELSDDRHTIKPLSLAAIDEKEGKALVTSR